MQDGAYKEEKPSIITENIRNLRQTNKDKKFWLIDNESGLLDAYMLMYENHSRSGPRFIQFHSQMLKTMCIFQRKITDQVAKLASMKDPAGYLLKVTQDNEPLFKSIQIAKKDSHIMRLFLDNFHNRLKEVKTWIDTCRNA